LSAPYAWPRARPKGAKLLSRNGKETMEDNIANMFGMFADFFKKFQHQRIVSPDFFLGTVTAQ